MIYLAYDGSVNGDWIAWYALTLAAHDVEKHLVVFHIDSGDSDPAHVEEKAIALSETARARGIDLSYESLACLGCTSADVTRTIIEHVPAGRGSLLVMGTRAQGEQHGYLAGTISEHLLKDRTFPVLALRVMQPGLLGTPHRFLMPVAGDPGGFNFGRDIIKRFQPLPQRVDLLHVKTLRRRFFRILNNNQADRLNAEGWAVVHKLADELGAATGLGPAVVHANAAVSDDWAQEVIITANRHKTQLILMEASRHDMDGNFFYGNPMEVVLRNAPCDVALYRGV